MTDEFWLLVAEYGVQIPDLSKALNAPLKTLCLWARDGAPEEALRELKEYLEIPE